MTAADDLTLIPFLGRPRPIDSTELSLSTGLGAGGTGQSAIVDPTGRILHEAQSHEQLMPIEIDLGVGGVSERGSWPWSATEKLPR
jgi:predicted amidohydrolase